MVRTFEDVALQLQIGISMAGEGSRQILERADHALILVGSHREKYAAIEGFAGFRQVGFGFQEYSLVPPERGTADQVPGKCATVVQPYIRGKQTAM